jgi:opacity protein-like surface antigen
MTSDGVTPVTLTEAMGALDVSRAPGGIGPARGGSGTSPLDGLVAALAPLPVVALIAAAALAAPDRAEAQGLFEGWNQGAVTIYGWVPGIEGAQEGPNGEPIVSLDSVGILDVLDFAFMGTAEIRRDRVGLLFDLEYADLGADGTARGAIIPGADPANASVDTTLLMATGAVAYRVFEADRRWVDVYGGLRAVSVDADFTARVPALDFEANRSGSVDWVDGLVGLRGRAPLGDRFGVTGLVDVGGFGLGSSSDLTWQVQATLDYSFTERVVGRLGYRYMSIDHDTSDLKLDIDLSGPLVGVTFAF